jgi:hypothetical protein
MISQSPSPVVFPTLSLQSVPASHGILWIRQGFAAFLRYPLGFSGLFSAMMLAWIMLSLTPLVGPFLIFMAMPWFSLGFMLAAHRCLQSEPPSVGVFFEPLRSSRKHLLGLIKLGALFALMVAGSLLAAYLWDGDTTGPLMKEALNGQADLDSLAQNPLIQSAILLRMGLIALLSLAFWHTPGLVFWGDQPCGRSLVFSVVAIGRNLAAFLIYGVSWLALAMTLSLASSLLLGGLGLSQLLPLVTLISMTALTTVFYLSAYFSFRGCFLPAAALMPKEGV